MAKSTKPAGAQPATPSAAPSKGNPRFIAHYRNTRAHGGMDQLRFEAPDKKAALDAAKKCTGAGFSSLDTAAPDDTGAFFTWPQLVEQYGL